MRSDFRARVWAQFCLFSFVILCVSQAAMAQTVGGVGTVTVLSSTGCHFGTIVRAAADVQGDFLLACTSPTGNSVVRLTKSNSQSIVLATGSSCGGGATDVTSMPDGTVYATCQAGGVISISPTGVISTIASSSACTSPYGIDVDKSTGIVYAACNNAVIAINGGSISTVLTTTQCNRPEAVLVASGTLFAACRFGSPVTVLSLNLASTTVTNLMTNTQCNSPNGLKLDSRAQTLYVICQPGGPNGNLVMTVKVGGGSVSQFAASPLCTNGAGIELDVNTGTVYLTCFTQGGAALFATTGTNTASPAFTQLTNEADCTGASGVAIYNGFIVAGCSSQTIGVTANTITALTDVTTCPQPVAVKILPDGTLKAGCYAGQALSVSGSLIPPILPLANCSVPVAIDTDPVSNTTFVACAYNNQYPVIGISATGALSVWATYSQCVGPTALQWVPNIGLLVACVPYSAGAPAIIRITAPGFVTTIVNSTICDHASALLYDSTRSAGSLFIGCTQGVFNISYNSAGVAGTPMPIIAAVDCTTPNSFAVSPVTGALLTTCLNNHRVLAATGRNGTNSITQWLSQATCTSPSALLSDPVTGGIYVACQGTQGVWGGVFFVNSATSGGLVVATTGQCPKPSALARDLNTGTLFVGCQSSSLVAISPLFRCVQGYFWTGGICKQCRVGTSRSYAMATTPAMSCQACTGALIAPVEGLPACYACQAGTFAPAPSAQCANCTAGRFSLAGQSECTACSAGRYGATPLLPTADCTGPCDAGWFCVPGSTLARQYPCGSKGLYCQLNSTLPQTAQPGYMTIGSVDGTDATMTNVIPCPAGFSCQSGEPTPCPAGRYQPASGQGTCIDCIAGKASANLNSTGCDVCQPGHTSVARATTCLACSPGQAFNAATLNCDDCGIGTYSDHEAALSCTTCPQGRAAPAIRSSFCTICGPGNTSYSDATVVPPVNECVLCPVGKSSTGDGPCVDCAAGSLASKPGSAYCAPCTAGQEPALDITSGALACTNCKQGWASKNGTKCEQCPPGYYNNATASITCTPCDLGYASALTGAASCSICGIGRFAQSAASTICQDCPTGRVASTPGSAICTICEPGYMNHTDLLAVPPVSRCDICPIGKSSTGAGPCVDCPPSSVAGTPGLAYCTPCLAGQEAALNALGVMQCVSCNPGSASANGTKCEVCGPGKFTNTTAAISCDPCDAGTASSVSAALSCTVCGIGRFAQAFASTTCQDCPIGRIASTPGSAICTICGPGYMNHTDMLAVPPISRCDICPVGKSSTGDGPCTDCPPGYLASTPGLAYCTPCLAGQEAIPNALGVMQCVSCKPGYASVNGTKCDACAPGKYTNASAAVTCDLCDVGTASDVSAALSCTICGVGRFASAAASLTCSDCPTGRVAANEGNSLCQICGVGSTNHTDLSASPPISRCELCQIGTAGGGDSLCMPCAAGSIAPTAGLAFCHSCQPGEEVVQDPITGFPTCQGCTAGSASSNGTACIACAQGFYSESNNAVACAACSAGTSSPVVGLAAKACPRCPAGQYQPSSASTVCLDCPTGLYSNGNGSVACITCPLPSRVNEGRTQCIDNPCPINYVYSTDEGECVPCPLGTAGTACTTCDVTFYTPQAGISCQPCSGIRGLNCYSGLAHVDAGYWAFEANMSDAYGNTFQGFQTSPCPPGFCPSSALQQAASTGNASSASSGSSSLDVQVRCVYPRENSADNLLCGRCVEGFIEWGSKCASCNGTNAPLLIGALTLSFALVLFLLRSGGSNAGTMSVVLFFIQTAALEVGTVAEFLTWLNALNLAPQSFPQCLANWTPYQQTLVALFMPLLLLLELAIIALCHLILRACFGAREDSAPSTSESSSSGIARLLGDFSWSKYVGGAMSILLFTYTQVATAALSYLNCITVGSASVVFSSPTMDCNSPEYKKYLVAVIIVLVVYIIGFPLWALLVLARRRSTIREGHKSASHLDAPAEMDARSRQRLFSLRWGPLYRMYAPHAWYWTPLLLLRRAGFVVAAVLLVQQTAVRFLVFLLLNFASLQAHAIVHPYSSTRLNRAESISYVMLVLTSAILTAYEPAYPLAVQVVVCLLVIPPSILGVLAVLHEQASEILDKLRGRSDSAKTLEDDNDKDQLQTNPALPSQTPKTAGSVHPLSAIELTAAGAIEQPVADDSQLLSISTAHSDHAAL